MPEMTNIFTWEFLKGAAGLLVGTAALTDVIRALLSEASKLLGPKWTVSYENLPRWIKMTTPFLSGWIFAYLFRPLDPTVYNHPLWAGTLMLGVSSTFAYSLYKPLLAKLISEARNRQEV